MMDEYLVYVRHCCTNADKTYEYDLFFSETPEVVWGWDWQITNPSSCTDLTPDNSTISKIKRIKSTLPFKTIQETTCYSMEYAIDKVVALSWIDITNMEEYPQNGRCVLHFGDNEEKVRELLERHKIAL